MKYLTNTEYKIYYYLNQLIHESELSKYILHLKRQKEFECNQNYHYDLWETIAGKFYNSMEIHHKKEARLLHNQEFLIKCDINLNYPIQSYYLITGYAYECRCYLLYLIKNKNIIRNDIFKDLDNTYSIISKRCTYRQKIINTKKNKKIKYINGKIFKEKKFKEK